MEGILGRSESRSRVMVSVQPINTVCPRRGGAQGLGVSRGPVVRPDAAELYAVVGMSVAERCDIRPNLPACNTPPPRRGSLPQVSAAGAARRGEH